MSVTIVLATDQEIYRQALRLLLEVEEDFRVVGEATTGLEVIQLVQALQPDVLVVDSRTSDLSGLEVTRQVQRSISATRVVMLSICADEAYIVESLRCGVMAYVLKGASVACLFQAIRQANASQKYISPPLSERILDSYLSKGEESSVDLYELLTPREHQVLRLAARGLTNAEVATALFISRRTVESHRASLMRKLNLRTQSDMIRYVLRRGIISMES